MEAEQMGLVISAINSWAYSAYQL